MMGQGSYMPPEPVVPPVVGQNFTAPYPHDIAMIVGQESSMAPEAVVVVGQQFRSPCSVDLTIVPKMMTISACTFGVTGPTGNIMFKVGKFMSARAPRILLDAADNPVVSFQKKYLSIHGAWKVYRGDSKDPRDVIFTVRKSSLFQFKTQLDVFLASNTSKEHCDFKIKGSWTEKSCTVYAGNSSNALAQMHQRHGFRSNIELERDKFAVMTVYPHVDYAFIVALIAILEEIDAQG